MARARNIKPSFFKNELLGTTDPLLGLLFIGLWTLADRDGKLEDRPMRIKAELFPYREWELALFNESLTQLVSLGFIWRYRVGETPVIRILKFKKHQSPHSTEKESELPDEPPEPIEIQEVIEITEVLPLDNASLTQVERSESLLLIPESPILNPESGKPAPADDPVVVYLEFFPENPLGIFQQEFVRDRVDDPPRWRKALTTWKVNKYISKNVANICDFYDELKGKENGTSTRHSEREKSATRTANAYKLADELERVGRAEVQAGTGGTEPKSLSSGTDTHHHESDLVS